MKLINQGILAAKGFVAVGEHIGIKKQKKIWLCYIVKHLVCMQGLLLKTR